MEDLGALGYIVGTVVAMGAACGFAALRMASDSRDRIDKFESSLTQLSRRLSDAEHKLLTLLQKEKPSSEPVSSGAEPAREEIVRKKAPAAPLEKRETEAPPSPVSPPPAPPQAERPLTPPLGEATDDTEKEVAQTSGRPVYVPPPSPTPSPKKPADHIEVRIREVLKRLGPQDPNMTWEMALGTFWLPRLGAVALSIAIVFLLTLAAQRWGPPVRVGLGYAVAGVLLAGGWRFDKKYSSYARVLLGAGFALTYLVTFATYFVPFAKLFEGPTVTLIGLALIVAAWAALAVRRRAPIIASIAVLLGHLAIGLTSFTVDEPALYSVLGIVALSLGSAYFLLRMRWYFIAAMGMVASYVNHFLLMSQSESRDTVAEFSVGMGVLAVYLLIYALAEFFAPVRLRRESVPPWFRNAFVTTNTVCFFALGTLLVDGYTFAQDYQHLFRYALALVLLPIGVGYLRLREHDPLFNTYLTKGVTAITFGLAAQFSAHTLTTWMAIEMVVLLVSARQSKLAVTRVLSFMVAAVALAHGGYSILNGEAVPYASEDYAARLLQACITVVSFFVASRFYQWVGWSTRSPASLPLSEPILQQLWKLDLLSERPQGMLETKKPLSGLLYPYLYAFAGVALLFGYTATLVELGDKSVATSLLAIGLAVSAFLLKSPPFGRASMLIAVAVIVPWGVFDVLEHPDLSYSDVGYVTAAVKASVATIALLFLSEFTRRIAFSQRGHRNRVFPSLGSVNVATMSVVSSGDTDEAPGNLDPVLAFGLALGGLTVFAAWTYSLIEAGHMLLTLSAFAGAMALLAMPLRALPLGLISIVAVALAGTAGTIELYASFKESVAVPGLILLALVALSSESGYIGQWRGLGLHQFRYMPYPLYLLVAWLLGSYVMQKLGPTPEVFWLFIAAIVAAALTLLLHRQALACCGVLLLLWAQLLWYSGWSEASTTSFLALAWGIMAVSLAGDRFYAFRPVRFVGAIHVVAAWCLLLPYIYLEATREWIPFWWAIGSAVFVVYASAFQSRASGVIGVAGIAIASLYQVVFAYDQEMDLGPLLAGFLAPAALWIALERAAAYLTSRVDVKLPTAAAAVMVATVTVLLVIMLERIPALAEFYLTISWSILGVALFGLALACREKMYRYAGLTVLLLASLRVLVIDTRELETLPKVGAWGVLGAVLIALGYGYVRAFARTQEQDTGAPQEEGSREPGTDD